MIYDFKDRRLKIILSESLQVDDAGVLHVRPLPPLYTISIFSTKIKGKLQSFPQTDTGHEGLPQRLSIWVRLKMISFEKPGFSKPSKIRLKGHGPFESFVCAAGVQLTRTKYLRDTKCINMHFMFGREALGPCFF